MITSLRNRLLINLLPVFILSFISLSATSYYLSQKALDKSVAETAIAIGADYAGRIESDVEVNTAHLEELAATEHLRTGDKELIANDMSEAFKRLGTFDALLFISADGSGIRWNKTTGKYSDREYFQKVLNTKKPYISKTLISNSTGKISFMIAVPVQNKEQVVGVLAATYTLDRLTGTIKELKFKDSGYGAIVDNEGLLLAHPLMPELVGKFNYSQKKINPELKLGTSEVDDNLISLFKTAVETGKRAMGKYVFIDGKTNLAVCSPINLPGEQRWFMVVAAPEAEVVHETIILARTMALVSLLFVILAAAYITIISGRFAKPITLIRNDCLLLTQGDLSERAVNINSHDEIGQLAQGVQEMRHHLRSLITNVQSQAEQVAASSEELTATAHQAADAANQVAGSVTEIATGTQTQAASTSYISKVSGETSNSLKHASNVAQQVLGIALEATEEAQQGRKAVELAIDKMAQIGRESEAVEKAILELAQGSNEITEIVELISSIAGQTNLLALNAAIEAARAGEHGKGFAVVAEEVRKLAEESNRAAQQIGGLIQRNQQNMDQAVEAIQAGSEGVQAGVGDVTSAGDTFRKIVATVIRLTKQIEEISDSIQQIGSNSQTLANSIQEIDKISKDTAAETQTVSAATEQQSAAMQEIAASSQGLAKLADKLQESVARFRV